MPPASSENIVRHLNETQMQAVTFGEGPLLVIAGAGSGKTRVITHRIAHLIERGVPADRILGITFTNKAASEMARRVEALVGGGVMIKTFHALCALLLRRHLPLLGYDTNFSVYDRADSLRVVKRIIRSLELDPEHYKPSDILDRISRHKDDLETPDEADAKVVSEQDAHAARCYRRYEEILKENNALDFDDLLVKTIRLFDQHPDVLQRYQQHCMHLLVDEYQDTNFVQHLLARALQGHHRNITAVGDPDQMIYTWRGARLENIMQFEREFPGASVIALERNYRSSGNILRAASHAIRHNRNRHDKKLYTTAEPGSPVTVAAAPDPAAEADWVAKTLRTLIKAPDDGPAVGILYRTKLQSSEFERALAEHGISYQVVDTTGFFERKAVKDIAAYLHLIVNPHNEMALRRIINSPPRGIGAGTVHKLDTMAAHPKRPLLGVIFDPACRETLPARARKAVEHFARMLQSLSEQCHNAEHVQDAVRLVLDATDYIASVKDEDREDAAELLDYFYGFAQKYQQQTPDADLAGFMAQSVLASDVDGWDPPHNSVSLLTLHSAKGLEFDVVFLTGVESCVLPHSRALEERNAMGEDDALEEERRLFHVGMTRARQRLYLSYALERRINGFQEQTGESPFLMELPEEGVSWHTNATRRGWRGSGHGRWPRRRQAPSGNARKASPVAGDARSSGAGAATRQDQDMPPGTIIHHEQYGEGALVSISRAGNRKLLRINFPQHGVLTILQ